jgi:Ca2+-binding EF-hand superfamily protein
VTKATSISNKRTERNYPNNTSLPTLSSVAGVNAVPIPLSSGKQLLKAKRPSTLQMPSPNGITPQSTPGSTNISRSNRKSFRVGDSPASSIQSSPAFESDDSMMQRHEAFNLGSSGSSRNSIIVVQQQQQPPQLGRHTTPTSIGGSMMSGNGMGARRQSKMLKPSQFQQQALIASPPPSINAPSSDIASRKWKDTAGEMTFGQRVQLAEHPERWADWSLAQTNMVSVWEHYDTNGNGELDRNEITQLASDVVDRFCVLYEEQLIRDHRAASQRRDVHGRKIDLPPDEIKRLMKKDIFPHLLPGESVMEAKRAMTERLMRELDVDRDGCITRTEFLFQWKNTSKLLLTINPPSQKRMACIIL